MQNINIEIQKEGAWGQSISTMHFGSSVVFRTDSVEDGSTFIDVVEQFNFQTLRYPGGTTTETYFDLNQPNAPVQENFFNGHLEDVIPIADFINFCSEYNIQPIIVLPTYRYFDQSTRHLAVGAADEIKKFVKDVLNGEYGHTDVYAFEIGNEWFNDNLFNWTVAEFAELQKQIALIIDQALQEVNTDVDPKIYVQTGHGEQDLDGNGLVDNFELSNAFNSDELQAIDGVIDHLYAAPRYNDPLALDRVAVDRISALERYWTVTGDNALDIAITEWNVGEHGPDTLINGMERMAPLVQLFVDMIANGVDIANIWTVQSPGDGPAALSDREGQSSNLTPTGELFALLSDLLVDTQISSSIDNAALKNDNDNSIALSYSFTGNDKAVSLFASGLNEDIQIYADFNQFMHGATHISATMLKAKDNQDPSDYYITSEIIDLSYGSLDGAIIDDGIFDITIPAYSVIAIEFLYGLTILGDLNGTYNNSLLGGSQHDIIKGKTGNDLLNGKDGHDILYGGSGNDTFLGGNGNDFIYGGSGSDRVRYADSNEGIIVDLTANPFTGLQFANGGTATGDQIYSIENATGSSFSDTIHGDNGINHLSGLAGSDTIYGKDGKDLIMGGAGADILYGGANIDTLRYSDSSSAVHVDLNMNTVGEQFATGGNATGDQIFEFENVTGSNYDDQLIGNTSKNHINGLDGDDTIVGGDGNDLLIGGAGSDRFVFNELSGKDTIADFEIGFDTIEFKDNSLEFSALQFIQKENDLKIKYDTNVLILKSTLLDDISDADFLFI